MGTDRTTLTRNLAILEREGLIKISEGTDHRTRNVTATQKGRGAIARAIPLWNEVQHKVKQKMGESSWQGLSGITHDTRYYGNGSRMTVLVI